MQVKRNAQIKRTTWRLLLVTMPFVLWVSLVAAQEEGEVVADPINFGVVWAILLVGAAVVLGLGFAMSRRDSNSNGNNA